MPKAVPADALSGRNALQSQRSPALKHNLRLPTVSLVPRGPLRPVVVSEALVPAKADLLRRLPERHRPSRPPERGLVLVARPKLPTAAPLGFSRN